IHQEPMPFADLSVAENILTGSLPRSKGFVDWKAANAKASSLLSRLGSKLDVTRTADNLSIADQQMLELAAAMSHDAKVWIFDETTAPLTPNEVETLFRIMRELRDQGCALAIVTHHLDEVFHISDEITVLRDGAKVAHLATGETTQSEIVRLMVGRDIPPREASQVTQGTEIALDVDRLCGPGFREVTLSVAKGEIYGLAGLVGSGRTELARALFGITQPTFGGMFLLGKPYYPQNVGDATSAGVALVPEDRRHDGLMLNRSILENAALASGPSFASRFGLLASKRERELVAPLLARLRVAMRSDNQTISELSGGNQQKVVLAKWLLKRPHLLILDEPTRGVDVGAKAEIHDLIRELASEGVGVLLISSDLPEVLALSDRVGVMRRGTLAGELEREEMNDEALMQLATGVTS
ncbi:MAG TPA: sugar ABC transporter ATP-binding protein, partial [Fimbriimonas sp.]|nr:sugar ABC transporter ATP-binding protein [Fimbriimonas sp.]